MKATVKCTVLASIVLTVSLFLGCSRHDNSERYILVTVNSKLPYWQTAAAGLSKAAGVYGVKWDIRPVQKPTIRKPRLVNFAMPSAIKPAGILVSVADPKLMTPEIDAAMNAAVPVITIDSDAPDSHRLYFIGTNNLEAGHLGGQRVVDKLDGKGNVVFYTMPQPNMEQRLKGYKDVFADHPGIKITEVFNIKGDSGNAFDRTAHYLRDKSAERVDAFICLEASSGKDVAEAVKRENATDRLLIAMDVDEATLNLIKNGVIDSTISEALHYGLLRIESARRYSPLPG